LKRKKKKKKRIRPFTGLQGLHFLHDKVPAHKGAIFCREENNNRILQTGDFLPSLTEEEDI
jgi:hypothetical protein